MSQGRDDETSVEGGAAIARSSVAADGEGSEPLPAGTVLAGRYQVRKLIGRGGTGIVVEAWDGTLGVSVAIKVVRSEYAGQRQWTERLAREVKLARKIQHPNVCRVFDFAQADGRAFLIMELADGGTLRSQISAEAARARPLADRLADARAIAAGVAAIHAAGIVHRDISPQNVLRMADGRLVVSDFGLATDTLGGTTSIHGGTMAYMAPEVLHGGRANFASDVWSLGAVIHEVVFGEPLRWDPKGGEIRSAVSARSLSQTERSVLEICGACMASNPARRPRDAGAIASRLREAGLARVAWRRRGRRALGVATAGLVVVAALAGARRVQSARRRPAEVGPATDPLMIVPTGEPVDWTDKAKVLAEVPAKLRCVVALPDRRTVRFVWGYPPRAEDLDTHSGERKPSPLVPDAYAEGCPSLSPDRQRLVYAGHTGDGRAFAFVSEHPDGRAGVPEVQTAEPSYHSDPVWLADGESFVYDVDEKHVAVFSTITKRSSVMPTVSAPPVFTTLHEAIGNQIFVNAVQQGSFLTEIVGFQYPRLEQVVRWKTSGMITSLASSDGKAFYYRYLRGSEMDLVETEPFENRARLLGTIRGEVLGAPLLVEGGMVLHSIDWTSTLVFRSTGTPPRRVRTNQYIPLASRCGGRIIAARNEGMRFDVVWLDDQGRIVGSVTHDGMGHYPICSSDGSVIFYGMVGERTGIKRCDRNGCRTIFQGTEGVLAISPDDKRLAFMVIDGGGISIRWISSDGTGPVHQITYTENMCGPIWASDENVWVSLRKGHEQVWTEFDSVTARPTGRTFLGSYDCADGMPDPRRPLYGPVEVERNVRTRLRLLTSKDLSAGERSR